MKTITGLILTRRKAALRASSCATISGQHLNYSDWRPAFKFLVKKDEPSMNLTNLVRLCGAVALAWILLAMGVGIYGIKDTSLPGCELTSCRSPQFTMRSRSLEPERPGHEEFRLVDRSTGKTEPFPLPEDERWGC